MGSIRSRRSLVVLGALAAVAAGLVWTQVGGAVLSAGDQSRPGAAAVTPQATPGSQVGGTSSHWVGIDRIDNPCTTNEDFVDMPGMSLTFQTTRHGQRVLIHFQAEWIGGDQRVGIRALVDGIVVTGPGDDGAEIAAHEGPDVETNGFTFISDPISHPGLHTAKIQWARFSGAGSACVDDRSFVVQG